LLRNPTSPRAAGRGKDYASRVDAPLSEEGIGVNAPEPLIVAYRDGLGIAAVILIAGESGARLMHGGDETPLAAGGTVHARWWCKSTEQAEWLVAALAPVSRRTGQAGVSQLCRAVLDAAKRFGIMLRSDEEILAEARAVIARLEQEIAAQQRAGVLRSVNRAYRDYRLAASARGEKVLRYAQWMERYKAKLIREIAQNLRSL
jgi:hypothetical protein